MIGKKKSSYLYASLKNNMAAADDFSIKKEKKEIHIRHKLVVSVTALKHGAGCSYMSVAVANFLSGIGREKACLLNKGCAYIDSVLDNDVDSIYYPCDMSDVYSKYGYIVYDGGVVSEADKNMIERSDIKLMMCWPNDEYKRLLADFIKNRRDINNWIFLFNMVPARIQNDILALMEDYHTYCVPLFDIEHMDKSIRNVLKNIFENV